jgi:hypothetical protein
VAATYIDFIGISSNGNASQPQNDIGSNRNVSAVANARLDILPGREWRGAISAAYVRAIRPNSISADPDLSFNTDTAAGSAEIDMQPGRGTLTWRWGAEYSAQIYEHDASAFSNGTFGVFTGGNWNFRPRSMVFYAGTLSFQNYYNSGNAAGVGLTSAVPVRSTIGISSLLTNRLSGLASVGYGGSFLDQNGNTSLQQYDSVIGQAELRYYLADSAMSVGTPSSVVLGYVRQFAPSQFSNFYGTDSIYLGFQYFLAHNFILSLNGGLAWLEYPTLFWDDPAHTKRHDPFTDLRATAALFAEYRVLPSLGINGTVGYSQEISSVNNLPIAQNPTSALTSNLFDMGWVRFYAFLGIRWFI